MRRHSAIGAFESGGDGHINARMLSGPCIWFRSVVGLLVAVALSLPFAPARADDWRFSSPFETCAGDCAVTFYGGTLVQTPMWEIFVTKHQMPWQWNWRSSYLVAGAASRELVAYRDWVALEAEVGAGKRFGFLNEGEFWGALYLRWKLFPWNDYVRTTVAVSTGLNYATEVPPFERYRTRGPGSRLLHFLSPEITFGLPSMPDLDLVLRFHHRSGAELGFFNHTSGGAQYGTAGIRYRF